MINIPLAANHYSQAVYSDRFFRDGSRVPAAFREVSWNGQTGLVMTPRGKRPRVYSKARIDQLNASEAQRKAQADAKRAAQATADLREARDAVEGFDLALVQARLIASNPPQIRWLKRSHDFISELVNSPRWSIRKAQLLVKVVGEYNQRVAQADAAQRQQAQLAENPANWLRSGKQEISGIIRSKKETDGPYGYQLKITLELDNGARLYGTLPKAVEAAEVGDRIAFSANVQPSENDKCFGFYSRPTKSKIVQ